MKKIDKQTLAANHLFMVYYEEFKMAKDENGNLIEPSIKPSEIWNWFNRNSYAVNALHQSLLEEQGYICAFCGCRIEKSQNFSVEHFLPKSKLEHGVYVNKHLTLAYNNLLGSCETTKVQDQIQFPIQKAPNLDKLQDIADYLNNSVADLIEKNKQFKNMTASDTISSQNAKIQNAAHHIRSIKYKPNTKHCNFAKLSDSTPILDPTSSDAVDCEKRFIYILENKQHASYCKIKTTDDEIIMNTVTVCNLNATDLCEKRVDMYNETSLFLDSINEFLAKDAMTLSQYKQEIQVQIDNAYQKENGKLEPFCFVKVAILLQFI